MGGGKYHNAGCYKKKTIGTLKKEGWTYHDMKVFGFTMQHFQDARITIAMLKADGWDIADIKAFGWTGTNRNYSRTQVATPQNFKAGGFNEQEIRAAGGRPTNENYTFEHNINQWRWN